MLSANQKARDRREQERAKRARLAKALMTPGQYPLQHVIPPRPQGMRMQRGVSKINYVKSGEVRQGPSGSAEGRADRGGDYWFRRSVKLAAQQEAKAQDKWFAGVHCFIDGYTGEKSHFELTEMINQHGGKVSTMFAKKTITHIICRNLAATKVEKLLKSQGTGKYPTKVVTPEWIDACCDAGRRVDEAPFLVLKSHNTGTLDGFVRRQGPRAQTSMHAFVASTKASADDAGEDEEAKVEEETNEKNISPV